MSNENIEGGTGITAGGNVTFGDVSGNVAIGGNNTLTSSSSDKERKEILKNELGGEYKWRSIDKLTSVIGFDNEKEECKEKCRNLLLKTGARRSVKKNKEMWGLMSRVGTSV